MELVRVVVVERDRLPVPGLRMGLDGATLQRRSRLGRYAPAAGRQARPQRCDQGAELRAPGNADGSQVVLEPERGEEVAFDAHVVAQVRLGQ